MISDAPTDAGKHVTSKMASARSQRYVYTRFSLLIGPNDAVRYDAT